VKPLVRVERAVSVVATKVFEIYSPCSSGGWSLLHLPGLSPARATPDGVRISHALHRVSEPNGPKGLLTLKG